MEYLVHRKFENELRNIYADDTLLYIYWTAAFNVTRFQDHPSKMFFLFSA